MLCSGCNSFAVYAILILLQFSAMTLGREVGDPCQMNGVNGACATSCKVLEDGYKRKLIKRSDFVHCGYTQFEEIICCPTHLTMADAETGATPAPVTTTTTTTTTTAAPVTQRYEAIASTTTTTTTAKPDFWLHLLTTTTTTTSTTPEPLIYQGKELPADTEYIDLNSLLNGGNSGKNRNDEVDRRQPNANGNDRNQNGRAEALQSQPPEQRNPWLFPQQQQQQFQQLQEQPQRFQQQQEQPQRFQQQQEQPQRFQQQQEQPQRFQQHERQPQQFHQQQRLTKQQQQQLHHQQIRHQQQLRQQQQQIRRNQSPGHLRNHPSNARYRESHGDYADYSDALPAGPIFPGGRQQQMGQIPPGLVYPGAEQDARLPGAQQGSMFVEPQQQYEQERDNSVTRNPIDMVNEQLMAAGMEIVKAKLENVDRQWQNHQTNFFNENAKPSAGFEEPDRREPNTVSIGFPQSPQFQGQPMGNWQQPNSNLMGQQQPFESPQPVPAQHSGSNQQSVVFPVTNQQFEVPGGGFIQTPTVNNFQPQNGQRDPADTFWTQNSQNTPNVGQNDPTNIFSKQTPNQPSQPLIQDSGRPLDPFAPFAFRPSDDITSNDLETDTNAIPTSDTFSTPTARSITPISTDRPSVEICKRIESKLTFELSPHILDGIPAFLGEFPHAALIQFNTEGTKCGGALIDPKFVLTAAHCVINPRKAPISVRVGMVDAGNTKQGQEIRIVKLHIHPDYNSKLKYNDIALLELETAAFDWETVNWETVGPACLQTDPTDPPAGRPLIAIGWGLTNVTLRTQSEKLLKVELQLHDNNECNKQYQTQDALSLTTLPQGIINTQICAYASGKDACAGDSGGPLNLEIDSDRKYYNIIGVVSTGFSCGTDTPGLYTRVSSFLPYIESVVWPNGV